MASRGDGSIFYREDRQRWCAEIVVGDTGRRKTLYGRTRQEVRQKLAVVRRDLEQGLQPSDDRQTVAQYLEWWLEVIKPTLSEDTVKGHREYVRVHIIPQFGHVKLAKLTPQHVQELYASRLALGLSPTTVNHLHASLHKALANAVRLGLVPRNVSELVEVPRAAPKQMHPLSREEARRLLTVAADGRYSALFVVAVATGMRQGELLALRWRDVDLDGRMLQVRGTMKRNRETGQWYIKEPKTRGSRRRLALSDAVVDALRAHRARQIQDRLRVGPAWEDNDLIFCNEIGSRLSARAVQGLFERLLRRSELPRVRFHDLRHTCATLLLSARVNPKVVSEMLGHSTVSITLDIYSHVIPDMQQDAAATMAALLYG